MDQIKLNDNESDTSSLYEKKSFAFYLSNH
jgi:hypothetical protein